MSGLACPACGAPGLTARGVGEACPACGWCDVGEAADVAGAPANGGVSLTEARLNVARFGRALPPAEAGGS